MEIAEEITEEQKLEAVRQKFAEDLLGFSKFILQEHIVLEIPEFHREIYDLITSGKKRVAVAAPRGHAKSTLVSLAYVLWSALTGKKRFIIIVSDTYPQAKLFLESLKTELEDNDFLKGLYGSQKTEKWTEADIELKMGVRIMAKGAEMKFRGLKYGAQRPDLIVVDDLENDELVESLERRQKLERWFNGTLVPALDREGQIVYIGTILHDDALLMKVLNPDLYQDWETRIYKAIKEDETALWPEHMPITELNRLKEEYTKNGLLDLFMSEYMNDPITDENREFKREYFQYYTEPPKTMRTYMTVDLAISKKKWADYTVVMVCGVDMSNNLYVLEYERGRFDPLETIEKIFVLYHKYNCASVGIETVGYQQALQHFMRDHMRKHNAFITIEDIPQHKDKETRLRGLLPRFKSGGIYMKQNMTHLEEELLRFPKGKHDDILDALAMQLQLIKTPNPYADWKPTERYDSWGKLVRV